MATFRSGNEGIIVGQLLDPGADIGIIYGSMYENALGVAAYGGRRHYETAVRSRDRYHHR